MSYFNISALSYSSLRAFSIGPAYYKFQQEQESEEKEHFIIGSGVDIMLTESDKFWDYYYLEFSEKCDTIPTGQMLTFIDYITHNVDCGQISGDCYEEAYNYAGFKQKKLETVIEDFKKYDSYYKWCLSKVNHTNNNKDKQVLTNTQYQLITKICNSLRTNEFTKKYFENSTGKNIEIFNQLEIYWEYKQVKCKSKLDLVIVDHDSKLIQLIDLKTTGNSVFSFNSSSFKWRYDMQVAFYTLALYWLINQSTDEQWNRFKEYKFQLPKFIVESTKSPGMPLIYTCSDRLMQNALYNGFVKDGKYYKGIDQLVDDYKWHVENNSWSYSREIIENNGEIELKYD